MTVIRTCPQCGAPLPGGAAAWLCPKCLFGQAVTPLPREADSSIRPRALHYFGDYELLEEIARGGMGVVYKARQVSLNRIVAVKLLLFGKLAGDEFIKRFRAEAEAAASLQHSNIVAIHEVGEHEGQQYFSMDHVDGADLSVLVREKPLPARRAATYLKTIAEAIHYAHQRGVLHRDLKPSNILIDRHDQPRVTDFGLAKRLASDDRPSTLNPQLTITGQVLGTPGFMSPEQAGGKRGALGPSSDVYSLGALLYFLVTGRAPFAADSLEETLRQVHEAEPVSPRLLNANVPRDVETICLKCLNKEPARRYESALALADELNRWLNNEPIRARPAGAAEKLCRWCRRKPAMAALAAALLIVASAGLAGVLWQWRRAETNATIAIANLHQSYLAQAQALRASSTFGRRFQALDAIAKAAAFQPSLELRNEAIANLAQADLRVASLHSVPALPNDETFAPGFTLSAVLTGERRVEIRRAFSRELVTRVAPARGQVNLPRMFSPDERYLALATSADGTCVWDFEREEFVLRRLPEDLLGDFSPDSRSFAIGGRDGSVSFHDLASGREIRRWGDKLAVRSVAFDPSGQRLACSDIRQLEIRDVFSGELVRRLQPEGYNQLVAWSGDGHLLAAAGTGHRTCLWRVDNGELLQTFGGHGERVISVAMSPAGDFIATSSFDGTTRFWETLTGRALGAVSGWAWNLAFSSNGRYLGPGRIAHTTNSIFEVVHPTGFKRLAPPVPVTGIQPVYTMDFSPDDRLVALAASDGVRLWDRSRDRMLGHLPTGRAFSALFEPDGSALLITTGGELLRWPLHYRPDESARSTLFVGPVQNIGPAGGNWSSVALNPWNAMLAVASPLRRAAIGRLGNVTNWLRMEKIHAGADYIDLSPDGRFAASGAWNGRDVCIWDAKTGRLLHTHPCKPQAAVAFSPDRRWLMVGRGGEEYHALPVGTWTNWHRLVTVPGERPLGMMAFSPDGRIWARLRTATSWELVEPGTWRLLAVLQSPYPMGLGWPRFSRDGALLAAADTSLGVQIWNLRELRAELARMGLDWDHPSYPPASTNLAPSPLRLEVITDPITNRLGKIDP